jgi:pimeloyl-ACP methyl ester carboxylesterase
MPRVRYLPALGLLAVLTAAACTSAPNPVPHSSPSTTTGAEIAAPVDVGGGRTLYLECHGTGNPTVVLLSGFGNAADIWQVALSHPPPVATGVAGFTRVCSYDRPGSYVTTVEQNGQRVEATTVGQYRGARGNAVASTTPGSGAPVVAELHHLLEVAGAQPPYVLVGHSLGGLFTLLYARTYPQQVAGMVLVDSPTPNVSALLSPQARVVAFAAQSDPGPSLVPGYVNERYQVDTIFGEIDAAGPLPRVPLTYLQATIPLDLDQVPANQRPVVKEVTTQSAIAATAYVAAIPGARLIRVPDTTHYVQTERPDVAIAAIKAAVAGSTMTTTPTP